MTNEAIFKKAHLLTMSGDDEELARQVAGIFLFDIPKQFVALNEAIQGKDAKTAERIAHSIKGAAATVGGENLRASAFIGEQLGREGKLDELSKMIDDMHKHYLELEKALQDCGYESMDPDS